MIAALVGSFSDPAAAQGVSYLRPYALSPTDMKQCIALEAEWQKIRDAVSRQHQSCLDAVSASKRDCPDDRITGCSCASCAQYHNSGKLGQTDVDSCRKTVQAHQDAERQRKAEQEKRDAENRAQQRKAEDERRQRVDAQRQRDREARDRAAEQSRREQQALRERTARRDAERSDLEQSQAAVRDRYADDRNQILFQADAALAQLQRGIDTSFAANAQPASPVADSTAFDFSGLSSAVDTAQEFIDVRDRVGVIDDAISSAHVAFREWSSGMVRESVDGLRDSLLDYVVDDRDVADLARQVFSDAAAPRSGFGRLAERAYDSLAGSVADDVSADISSWINERLQTGPDRVAGRPWAGELGNAVVEQGVGYVINGAVEALKERAFERVTQLWSQATGSTPPPANTLERAEYDLWEHASPTNLLLSTFPLRGTAAVKGFYEWGTGLVDKFSTFMGFAMEDVAR